MYKTCPKCHYHRSSRDVGHDDCCPACGIIFSKWLKHRLKDDNTLTSDSDLVFDLLIRLKHTLLFVKADQDPGRFYLNLVIFVLFFIWGWNFIVIDFAKNPDAIANSFMHNINLVFHEAGHIIFEPFGEFMAVLGGSLMQLIIPLIICVGFIVKNHDNFSASIGLWWTGQSLIDLAPYINDAKAQQLPLLGGRTGIDSPGFHDWNRILLEIDALDKCHIYARLADITGSLLIILSLLWAAIILCKQYRYLR